MEIEVNQKQITDEERSTIDQQVKSELIEHLYQGCLPGTISGVPVGIALFFNFYHYVPTWILSAWFIFYNLALVTLTGVYFFYRKYKDSYGLHTWLLAYSLAMSFCAAAWGLSVLIIPENITRQYIAFIVLFLISTGYAMGSIGVVSLCLTTLTIIVIPLITWCLMKGLLFYKLVALFSTIYMVFMALINKRSTQWFKDSLKLKLENSLVSYQANHDSLTGLPNQRLFMNYLHDLVALSKNDNKNFAVICFSLNRMEVLNDSFGPKANNTILLSMKDRLNKVFSPFSSEDNKLSAMITISRKDTFNILLSSFNPKEDQNKLKDVFAILKEPFFLDEQSVNLTASVGVSWYPQDGDNAQSLLINAEAAMLQAKQFGGNRIEYYRSEINAQTPKQLALENDLHNALSHNQFLLYYQPLVDVKSGTIHGMEALIRWKHPVHGFISPAHFIPMAEETGLIVPIGEWVLREACQQTQIWHQMGFPHLKVAVNFAGKQLQEDDVLDVIKRALVYTGLDAKFLELEITETAILNEKVVNLLSECKKIGLSLSIDDFGTGYSGLSYLKRFAIDKIKIDQSFVRDIPANKESMAIVSAILAMAKALNVTTLAEGVEEEAQLQFLRKEGCHYIQGYYFSKPLEVCLFTQLLCTYRDISMYQKA
ncbi:MAG TPA: EAL domain-containing protein [Gammaproteobacteria bacterium]|nr:EAL domain-containing protein [Gammaproteobacteria bacterium]